MKKLIERPGYFGRRRDEKVAALNERFGDGKWRLVWVLGDVENPNSKRFDFRAACRYLYERSYFEYLKDRPEDIDMICSYGECIDNAPTNVQCGLDYSIQEAFSTHIQDIAIRNVLYLLGRQFGGPSDKVLVIRSKDSDGYKFGPGNVPFAWPEAIHSPSKVPQWANSGSVEDFWQSNKWIEAEEAQPGVTNV